MVDEEVEVTEDAAPLRAIVSLEDLFENIDRSVERYVKMDLYAYCPMITGPKIVEFGGRLEKAVSKRCSIDEKYKRTYWNSRGVKVVERSISYARQRIATGMKKKFMSKYTSVGGGLYNIIANMF